jgi:hypothetical protein
MGRWIAGTLLALGLLAAALFASTSASSHQQPPTLSDDFSLGVIDDAR